MNRAGIVAAATLIPDHDLEKELPKLVPIVEVTTRGGHIYRQRVDSVRGTVANPMTREEVITKFQDLTQSSMASAQRNRVVDLILNIEAIPALQAARAVLHGKS
ncbi:MmgE/PrpD family protein [Acidicapsa acidisoli]|uniref:MmgE/PrpD family protein n=1 Tax=Acidicapsa acidisoli TaxID=1615681 RepID=UPI0021DF8FAD|nr:MmgE/PrpD family protein [Acidicapsa acidisoli]